MCYLKLQGTTLLLFQPSVCTNARMASSWCSRCSPTPDQLTLVCVQTRERADVEKVHEELTAAKAALATAITEARDMEHKVCPLPWLCSSECHMVMTMMWQSVV